MNMGVYEAILTRRTVRDFQDREIDLEIIERILDAGLHAPTNNHLREWEFVVVNDKAARLNLIDRVRKGITKEELVALLDDWECFDPVQREMYVDGVPKQYKMLLTAGCLIIPCFRQRRPLLQPSSLSALNGFASIWCCIENILLAAAAEGIYGVTRIPFDEEIGYLKELLRCPADYEIPCYLALGYPAENAPRIKQLPIKAKDRMHFNAW
jgi:nitroreductase